jgi:hypothetical protein
LDSIGWAKDLRYLADIFLALVPDYRAKIDDDIMKMCQWVLKDREGTRFDMVQLYFNKPQQWFYDNSSSAAGGQVVTGQVVKAAPVVQATFPTASQPAPVAAQVLSRPLRDVDIPSQFDDDDSDDDPPEEDILQYDVH